LWSELLEDSERELESLATDIGGKIGTSEDDLPQLERTIEVLAAIDFLKIDGENNVALVADLDAESTSSESTSDGGSKEEQSEGQSAHSETDNKQNETRKGTLARTSRQDRLQNTAANLSVSLDATEMNAEELREKLEVVKDVFENDTE